MYLDKTTIEHSLKKEDIINIVCSLGSAEPKEDTNGNLIFQTICHNKPDVNNSWKLYYYFPTGEYKTGIFKCYTGCGECFGIYELVIRAKRTQGTNLTFYQAVRYVANLSNNLVYIEKEIEEPQTIVSDFDFINKQKAIKNRRKDVPQLTPISENILDIFSYYPYEGWLEENISAEAMSVFEIGVWTKTCQITIPHRDKTGALVGIRGRHLLEDDINAIGKYVPLYIEGKWLRHQLGNNLYGIWQNQDKIKKCKKCMLVESEKSVLQGYSYFGEDNFILATCGSSLTKMQIKLLVNYLGVEEVLVGFDRMYHDPHSFEAQAYYEKLLKKVVPLMPYCKVSLVLDTKDRIEYKQSPTDYGKEVLLELLDEKIRITEEEVKQVLNKTKLN